MGSLRNPVGPLPSSIYWRRRTVVSALVLLLAALVVWAVTRGSGGGGGDGKNASSSTKSHTPAGTITPGPASSGPHISGHPGGRDTAPPDDGTGGGDGGSGADGGTDQGTSAGESAGGDTAAAGSTGGDGSNGGAGGGGSAGAASAGSGPGGDLVPVGSTLPDCSPSNVSLSLGSEQRDYPVGGPATLQLHATNNGSVTCKLDFGPTSAVFSITATPGNDHVWASDDCPASTSPYLLRVPAHGSTVYTLRWDGKTSSPKCASPKGRQAAAGNYLAEVALHGYPVEQATFTLSQD